jgi:uncharacterized membrane protein
VSERLPGEEALRLAAAVLALLGIGVATYITIADASSGSPVCLAGGQGCETVAHSRYSHLAGINVAALGIGAYVTLFAVALLRGDAARFTSLAVAAIGFGFSVYLTYLELFVIDAVCQWCVASAVLMTLLFAVNAARAFGYAGAELAGAGAVEMSANGD